MIYRRIVSFSILVTLATVAACTSPPPRSEEPELRRTVVSIPLDIGKLKIEKSIEYADRRLGEMYSYAGNMALQPDVFIYRNPFLEGSPAIEFQQQSLGRAVESFKREINISVERGAYDSVDLIDVIDVSHDWKYGAAAGKRVSFTIMKDQYDFVSHAYFFAIDDMLLKVRMSSYPYPGLSENMDWFVGELLQGARVARYNEDGGAMVGTDPNGDVEEQLRSQLDDLYVVKTRNASMESAIVDRRNREVFYGEFDRKEPIVGPVEAELAGVGNDGLAGAGDAPSPAGYGQ